MRMSQWLRQLPIVGRVLRFRFIRFGAVGFSGTVVNLAVLYLGQETLFASVKPDSMRLNVSLALAIFCATVNNFIWNRAWTWSDRVEARHKHILVQLGQYFVASWFSIVLQFVMTRVIAIYIHYLVANVLAIVAAAVVGYLINDIWTFSERRGRLQITPGIIRQRSHIDD